MERHILFSNLDKCYLVRIEECLQVQKVNRAVYKSSLISLQAQHYLTYTFKGDVFITFISHISVYLPALGIGHSFGETILRLSTPPIFLFTALSQASRGYSYIHKPSKKSTFFDESRDQKVLYLQNTNLQAFLAAG